MNGWQRVTAFGPIMSELWCRRNLIVTAIKYVEPVAPPKPKEADDEAATR